MFDLVVQNGQVVTSGEIVRADIGVKDGVIRCVGSGLPASQSASVIDAEGMLVFPGIIDCHVHSSEPGYEEYEDYAHLSSAAAVAGTTTIIDMPVANDPPLSSAARYRSKEGIVTGKSHVDYAFWGSFHNDNLDDLPGMAEAGAAGIKAFLCPGDTPEITAALIRKELQLIKGLGITAGFHCEQHSVIEYEEAAAKREGRLGRRDFLDSRPVIAELLSVQTVLEIARETGARVHICHVTHPTVAEAVKRAKLDGVSVTAETCGNYLLFDETDLLRTGALLKCTPPLREPGAKDLLWEYVKDGTLDCLCSDHSPTTPANKDEEKLGIFGVWAGVSSAQSLFQGVFSEAVHRRGVSPVLLARCFCENPARIFGMEGRKGKILPGYDADLALVDPDIPWKVETKDLLYKNRMSGYAGLEGRGKARLTILRGTIIAEDGRLTGAAADGRLLKPDTRLKKEDSQWIAV